MRFAPDGADAYRAYYNRAEAYFNLADYTSAQADLTRCLALKPDDGKAYYVRGLTRSKLGDQPGAIADLERALRLFTDQGNAADAQLAREALHWLGQYPCQSCARPRTEYPVLDRGLNRPSVSTD